MSSSSSSSSSSSPWVLRVPLVQNYPRSALPVPHLAALLLSAVYDGDVPKVKTLVKRMRKAGKGVEEAMAEVTASWYKGHGPLHMAALSGKAPMCKFLIKYLNPDIDAVGKDGVTPLIYAILGPVSITVTRLLLDHHADPNKAAFDGSTPLHSAIIRDNYEIAELLLSRRACVDTVSECGTPLYIAAKNGNAKMLKLLLQHQADPNRVLCTPLKATICAYSIGSMELPAKAGADINVGTITPLIAAAYAGSVDCIECLLKADADANIPDHNGRMPIEIAATQGWQECVDVLFAATTPLAQVADWSTAGIIQHAKPVGCKMDENGESDFEAQGDEAICKSDFAHALDLYTLAVEINPDSSPLYAKRSLCSLHAGGRGKALDDANIYKDMQPDLTKSCSAQAAALILVKEYDRAVEALMAGLNLQFGRKPTGKEFSGDHPEERLLQQNAQ
ncbi:unnamed protein product [Urochloa humidicola]